MKPYTPRTVWLFFLLTIVSSAPFLLLGALDGQQLVPGVPLSGLAVVCPVGAATLLCYRLNGRRGALSLLKRSFDAGRIGVTIYLLPLLLLMPLVMFLSYETQSLTGTPLPAPQVEPVKAIVLFIVFVVAALGEELGWTGFATDPLQHRFGALAAALIIGVVWSIWHYPALREIHRPFSYIAWWTLGTVAARIIIVWLYNNTGKSVFAAAVFHAMINLTWQLFPIDGSYYDPRITGVIMLVVAVAVTVVWSPKRRTWELR